MKTALHWLALGTLLAGGCIVHDDPLYCDEQTPCSDPARPYCDLNGEIGGTGHTCIPSPFDSSPPDSADAPPECTTSAGCPVDSPICSAEGTCGPCDPAGTGDADCASRDGATPFCAADGTCVECRNEGDCTSTAPVCDEGACRGCLTDAECASEVCDETSGACAPASEIVYVDKTTGSDGPACGGQSAPCASIAGAQGGLAKIVDPIRTLKVRAAVTAYAESITIQDKTVHLVGELGVEIAPPAASQPVVQVRDNAGATDVTLEALVLRSAIGKPLGVGVRCVLNTTPPTLRLLGVTVSGNEGVGVESTGCSVTIERSMIKGNDSGGVSITNGNFELANNFIVGNGTYGAAGTLLGGVSISNSGSYSPQVFAFNTVAGNQTQAGAFASGVVCSTSVPITARSSIVFLNDGAAEIAGSCAWAYSDIETASPVSGTGNLNEDPVFVQITDPADYHIQATSPCRNAADPAGGTSVDYDGEPRPAGGSGYDMGADEVP